MNQHQLTQSDLPELGTQGVVSEALRVTAAQQRHHSPTRPHAAHIDVRIVGVAREAMAAPVQQLQFFLSESAWEVEAVTARTLQLLASDPLTAANAEGALVIDDTGERKDGCTIDHVARQYLGSVGKIDNGIVAVTTLWAHELRYYPLHVKPYTPESRLADGKQDPALRTRSQIALALVERAQAAGIAFKAIVADCFYGGN